MGLFLVATMVVTTAAVAIADHDFPPIGRFADDNGNIFERAIEAIAAEEITVGCNPPANDHYCPDDNVTRGEMAVFLVRAFDYTDNGGGDLFVDDDGLFYENAADRLKVAEVTLGCNPPTNDRYCGERFVTRGQMAAFLARALDLPEFNGPDRFVDDNGHLFEGAIERIAAEGITVGCNPPDNDEFCPDDLVTRGQMAAFLARALDLAPIDPAPPPNPGDTKNCADFATQADAQEWHDFYFPFYGDIANLDGDADGEACELLP